MLAFPYGLAVPCEPITTRPTAVGFARIDLQGERFRCGTIGRGIQDRSYVRGEGCGQKQGHPHEPWCHCPWDGINAMSFGRQGPDLRGAVLRARALSGQCLDAKEIRGT